MKILRRTVAIAAVSTLVGLGFTGVAAAVDYTPVVCTNGQVAVGDTCVDAAVESTTVEDPGDPGDPGDPAVAAAVQSAGTLPYTGNDSSLPLAELGVGLLAAGGLVTVMVRRRQTADQA